MKIKISPDGDKNALVTLSGFISAPTGPVREVLSFVQLKKEPKAVRLDSIMFLIEEKLGFKLWWILEEGYELICPLESRGYFDFEKMQSLHSPKDATGIGLSWFKGPEPSLEPMSYLIMLDLVKQ